MTSTRYEPDSASAAELTIRSRRVRRHFIVVSLIVLNPMTKIITENQSELPVWFKSLSDLLNRLLPVLKLKRVRLSFYIADVQLWKKVVMQTLTAY